MLSAIRSTTLRHHVAALERSRRAAIAILLGLIALLALILPDLSRNVPRLPHAPQAQPTTSLALPLQQMNTLLSVSNHTDIVPPKGATNPFHTTHFQPPPPPAAPAPPKPATVRNVELTYRGFYRTATGERRAFVQAGDKPVVTQDGETVIGDLVIAEISYQKLTLTNSAGNETVLEFNKKRSVQIPAQ